ncbi:hypothetical protein HELRODRAFT_165380 [Helobdella robusta]|uniref:ISXO2-like transposase domain-containing protein n=1 Tax=Helobdella robusta TaxID=6412 RepID=T1EWP1_HELRO|nr:hypothetical protein HELRODRAFT_165380 [Helobdella robusta]ESN91355.1 hypothetical protein HELRODRAFT_165380 [Helobdella robusta]
MRQLTSSTHLPTSKGWTAGLTGGATIWSDQWAAYNNIMAATGLAHQTVNHSISFVAPNGVHTNRIKNLWRCAKHKIKRMNATCNDHMSSYLDEFLWQRSVRNRDDRFQKALELIRTHYPV